MNLKVDLIMESEQRSASAFNIKAVMRILSIVGPAFGLLVIALIVINIIQVRLEFERLKTEWAITQPRKAKADALRNQAGANQEILKQLKGISGSRLSWHEQLEGIIRITPADIQMRKISITQTIHNNDQKQPVRTFRIQIEGMAAGSNADQCVSDLKNSLLSAPVYASMMETANVVSYGLDTTSNADRNNRAFRIDCKYLPRKFE